MDPEQAPAAMNEQQDGGNHFLSAPGGFQAFDYHQDGQSNLLLTNGYGMSNGMMVDSLTEAVESPLPEFDYENFPPLNSENSEVEAQITQEKAMETHEIDPDAITPGQQSPGLPEGMESSVDVDLIDESTRHAQENLDGASSAKVLPSASSEHAATEPSQPAGLGHSHLDRPGQPGQQGRSGVDGTRSKVVENSNMAASMANVDRAAPGTWQDVAERMVLFTLPARGRPYKRPDLEDAVIRTGFPPQMIETFGEFERNFKYQMTVKTWQSNFASGMKISWSTMTRAVFYAQCICLREGSTASGCHGTLMLVVMKT